MTLPGKGIILNQALIDQTVSQRELIFLQVFTAL